MSAIVILSFVLLAACFNNYDNHTYSIQFKNKIKDGTEYKIDSILIKHSAKPYTNENILSASKIIYYEDNKRKFTNDVPNNYIAKELYFNLSNNKKYIVWHKGGELTLLGKFYIKRKDGRVIKFDSIKHEMPINYWCIDDKS